jgi:NFU1 iron-sulfur cluster scaffold homolog, mitochondrial
MICLFALLFLYLRLTNETGPYLIADGGNVAVESVDETNRMVTLQLQGACGSCASSTVTMQMGIERVIKEKWPDVSISQATSAVDNDTNNELSYQTVEKEVNRLRPALMALGSSIVELSSVDAATGTVVIRMVGGSSKVRQGLELAIADVPLVKQITFMDE